MKFNHLLLAMAMLFSAQAFAQNETRTILLDHEEDTANVTSLEDIIKTQEKVFSANYRKDVVTGVWKRKKHFSLSYAKTEMNGKKIEMYDGIKNPSYTADWAVNLKRSHTYSFHKNPLQILYLLVLSSDLLTCLQIILRAILLTSTIVECLVM